MKTDSSVFINVHYNGYKTKETKIESNETVAECAVNLWHQIITGFYVKVLDADFPEDTGAILCQVILLVI